MSFVFNFGINTRYHDPNRLHSLLVGRLICWVAQCGCGAGLRARVGATAYSGAAKRLVGGAADRRLPEPGNASDWG